MPAVLLHAALQVITTDDIWRSTKLSVVMTYCCCCCLRVQVKNPAVDMPVGIVGCISFVTVVYWRCASS
jgi:hypothetical protein